MSTVQLRRWQEEAFSQYVEALQSGKRTALWEATPGSGKTTAALRVVKHQLTTKLARNALIVVPTSHLRVQWARAAARFGIQLDSAFGGARSGITSDFHGAVVTYQQIGNRHKVFQQIAAQSVVVLDEVHHAGDGLAWGDSLRGTLGGAKYILCLSGTAFRSDSNAIPFVHYDDVGMSHPDYVYPYARAVEDGVCRSTAFFTYGGSVSWKENERVLSASFTDALDSVASSRRLRAAIDPESGWIEPMIRDAHTMLLATRKDHPDAGALIVGADQDHARRLASILTSISGEKPTLVLSDDSEASRKIKRFADSSSQWIVACNMVSEGVDIPRLRVGVYATTIRTKMYFRQFLGRIVRRLPHPPGVQVAYLYLPADPVLRQLAEEIENETKHCLFVKNESLFPEEAQRERPKREDTLPAWTALSGINSGLEAVIVHGNQLSLFGGSVPAEDMRHVVHAEVALRLEEGLTRSEAKAQLASEIKRYVGMFHRRSGKPHSAIHTLLNKKQQVRSQTHCTEEQLRARLALLQQLVHGRPESSIRD